MKNHEVRTHKSAEDFPYEEHLAYKVAEVAADPVEVPAETTDMIINRIIDNAAVGLSLIHISEPTRLHKVSRMPSSA